MSEHAVGRGREYGPCPTRGLDDPSRRPWSYDHAAALEGAHWTVYAGDGIDGWFVAHVGTEADAAVIVRAVNGPTLDVGRLKRAVANLAKRYNLENDPPIPLSVLSVFGYSKAPAEMDADLAAEYERLR